MRLVPIFFIERLYQSAKGEWVMLHVYNTMPEIEALIAEWIERCNTWRPHTANGSQMPRQACRGVSPAWSARRWKGEQLQAMSVFGLSIKTNTVALYGTKQRIELRSDRIKSKRIAAWESLIQC
jgi:hypothetical protein